MEGIIVIWGWGLSLSKKIQMTYGGGLCEEGQIQVRAVQTRAISIHENDTIFFLRNSKKYDNEKVLKMKCFVKSEKSKVWKIK